MSASVWIKLSVCGTFVAGVMAMAACTINSTTSSGDGGTAPVMPSGEAGGGGTDSSVATTNDSAVAPATDGGAGTCTLLAMISFATPACTTCAKSKCCAELHACLDTDIANCGKLSQCVNNCYKPDSGMPDAGGCEDDCFAATNMATTKEFEAWDQCVFATMCKTECLN